MSRRDVRGRLGASLATVVGLVMAATLQATPASAGSAAATVHAPSPVQAPAVTAYRQNLSAGTLGGVLSHGTLFASSARMVSGGKAERVPGHGQSLLAHAQVGNAIWHLRVPAAGRYQVSIVLRTTSVSPATVELVIGGRAVRRVTHVKPLLAVTGIAAVTVAIVVATTSSTLLVGVQGKSGTPAVSGISVKSLGPAPAATALPTTGPTTTPAAKTPAKVASAASAVATRLPAAPAGQAWASGAYPGLTIDKKAADTFAGYRNRPLDVADVFQSRDTWATVDNSFSTDVYQGFPGRLVIALPLLPDNLTASSMPAVASGQFDGYFRAFAANLQASGRGDSIIRLGWEFNGNWYSWSATNPGIFIAAFRRVVGDLRAVAPGLLIDWNGNLGYSQVMHNPFTELYPGDDVVDIVGVDIYDDQYNHVTDEASWQTVKTEDFGLDAWDAFAVAHGKKFSVPEWGLDDKGPGDNPFFIQKMHDWFAANAGSLTFEAYFNEPADYIGDSLDTNQNPKSAALYKSLFG